MKTKFTLGQTVTYFNKSHGFSLVGTIIAIDKHYNEYVIEITDVDKGPKKHWSFGYKDLYMSDGWSHAYEIQDSKFGPTTAWGDRRSLNPSVRVGFSSRNLKPAELQYDPKQAGDREDDI